MKRGGGGYGFLLPSEFIFRTTQELEYFFLSLEAPYIFPEFNIRLYDKYSDSDYLFFLHQNQNILLEENHNPPPFQVKWSFPNSRVVRKKNSERNKKTYPHPCKLNGRSLIIVSPICLLGGFIRSSIGVCIPYFSRMSSYFADKQCIICIGICGLPQ